MSTKNGLSGQVVFLARLNLHEFQSQKEIFLHDKNGLSRQGGLSKRGLPRQVSLCYYICHYNTHAQTNTVPAHPTFPQDSSQSGESIQRISNSNSNIIYLSLVSHTSIIPICYVKMESVLILTWDILSYITVFTICPSITF